MNAQQLRNSILQEAIEGRLVPQDPNDEPASVLLERIREEKKRLLKEGKLKKKDLEETPISEDEKPFEIPESWEWVRIPDIGISQLGKTKNPHQLSGQSLPYLCSINVYWEGINLSQTKEMLFEESEIDKYTIRKGDLLICEGGDCGRSAIWDKEKTIVYQNALHRVRFFCNIDSKYILYCLYLYKTSNQLDDYIKGETIKHLVKGELDSILFPLPPLAEQKRIVAKIEELLPKVEEYGKAQEELDKLNEELPERLKKSVLQEAISGKLVPQDPNDEPASVLLNRIREEKKRLVKVGKLKKKDLEETPISEDEIPFDIPDSWEWVRVNSILNVYSARRVHQKDWRNQGIPFYRAREIGKLADHGFVENDLYIEESLYEEFSKSGVPQPGDLMITAVGTLGKVYIVKDDDTFYYKDGSVLCMNNLFRLESKYLKYYVESPIFKGQYEPESQGTTVATLTMVRVNEYLIPLPPLAEQKRIVAKIEQLLHEIDKLKV